MTATAIPSSARTEANPDSSDRAFQLDTIGLQIGQAHEVTFFAAVFSVGASFEVFSLTILLTAVLLKGAVPLFIWALIVIYLLTGIFFLAYGSIGFRRTRHRRKTEMGRLAAKYLAQSDAARGFSDTRTVHEGGNDQYGRSGPAQHGKIT